MHGETNGGQQETQAQQESQTNGQEGQQQEALSQQGVGSASVSDYERENVDRDVRIAELVAPPIVEAFK